ncbi:metal ABC transporter substrate-binding protein [Bacillota bacterium Meth-B3]
MKKIMTRLCVCLLALSLSSVPGFAAEKAKPLSIVCTTFPQYDWARQILGDKADEVRLTLLLDNGVDLHNYQPTAQDIAAISICDLFIYVGGESDKWVEEVLETAHNPNLKAISLLASVEAKEEEHVEGMQAEEHDHGHEHGDGHDHGEAEYDEHVWLSLKNAKTLVTAICDALCEIKPDTADAYKANADAYAGMLAEMDARYQAVVDAAQRKTLLFADRFPFRYLTDDYKLGYYAAFVGCSAETEVSFETVAFLSGKVDELELPVVLTIEGTNHAIAQTVVANSQSKDQKIVTMNSIQSVTAKDVAAGASYLGFMEENLAALKDALN